MNKKTIIAPVCVMMVAAFAFAGVAYAMTSSVSNSGNTVAVDELSIDLSGVNASAAFSASSNIQSYSVTEDGTKTWKVDANSTGLAMGSAKTITLKAPTDGQYTVKVKIEMVSSQSIPAGNMDVTFKIGEQTISSIDTELTTKITVSSGQGSMSNVQLKAYWSAYSDSNEAIFGTYKITFSVDSLA